MSRKKSKGGEPPRVQPGNHELLGHDLHTITSEALDQYLVSEEIVRAALARENFPQTPEDFSPTVFTLLHDGDLWMVVGDSESLESAKAWVTKAAAYGEICGYHVWAGKP